MWCRIIRGILCDILSTGKPCSVSKNGIFISPNREFTDMKSAKKMSVFDET